MVTYLVSLHPGPVHLDCPQHKLLKKDTDFTRNSTYNAAFQCVKDAVISDTTLWHFDPSLPVTIQVDASQVGLGVVLLQDHKPVAFPSKALIDAKCCYANIEREMLPVVFRAERFKTYVYGRLFTIKSDHRPLEYHQIRPQAPGIHLPEEPGRHASLAAAHTTVAPGL